MLMSKKKSLLKDYIVICTISCLSHGFLLHVMEKDYKTFCPTSHNGLPQLHVLLQTASIITPGINFKSISHSQDSSAGKSHNPLSILIFVMLGQGPAKHTVYQLGMANRCTERLNEEKGPAAPVSVSIFLTVGH